MAEPRVLHIVPHTHWDREWYEPFENYRFRLVGMVDDLLHVLESDPGFRHFNFDGQTAAVEDYLEVRPEAEPRIAALVRDGRLAVGPWRILMDEFLCSPETIVRNLQQGADTAARLGARQKLGYIPDSFGHIAQMPQILRLAGLEQACVYRGVPSTIDRTLFRWDAPDGSSVRTIYLATSYSNAATLPDGPDDLIVRARRILEDLAPFRPGPVALLMNGTDHRSPEAHVPETIAKANAMQDEFELRIGSLSEYLRDAVDPPDRPEWNGELRSGARANLIMGVASARMPLKQAEFVASTILERFAEPLAALAGRDPGRLPARAWRWMVENSAHDSICGCGIDEVADQVLARYRQAARIAETVAADSLDALGARVDTSNVPPGTEALLVFNPSPRARADVIEATLALRVEPDRLAFRGPDGTTRAAQVLEVQRQIIVDMTLTGSQLAKIVPTIHGRRIGQFHINAIELEPARRPTIRLRLGHVPEGPLDVEAAKRTVEELIGKRPRARFRVLGEGPPLGRVVLDAGEVEGLGWNVLTPVRRGAEARPGAKTSDRTIENGLLRATVDESGRIELLHIASGIRFPDLLRFEDGGDAGDEYTYSPPDRDVVVIEPSIGPAVDPLVAGPVVSALRITVPYHVPVGLATGARARARRRVPMPIVVDASLRAGEPFLRLAVTVVNHAGDHRLRALFPLPFAAERSTADTAFHVTARGLAAEGGDHELGLATFPCRRWVDANDGRAGLAVFHRGTPEYELVGGEMIAVTLLRCVAYLSRQGMRYRAGPAGPALETPGAQLNGTHRFELALYPHEGDWAEAGVHRVAERFAYPARAAVVRTHPGALPPSGGSVRIEPESVQLSSLQRDGAAILTRVYNAADDPVEARVAFGPPIGASAARVVDLLGRPLGDLAVEEGAVRISLRPWEIATIRVEP